MAPKASVRVQMADLILGPLEKFGSYGGRTSER